ncbi:MAG: hypothetical protein JSS31_09510 [Proteobacteria bacterium]|nr:hypothetical protein [Pseudomonadota bacterium]MBS0494174.1 hypothetical protein [Pseudomonadota bacterium]
MTAAQRAQAIKRRKAIWEALHPEGGRISPTPGGDQKIWFAADTGAVTGESKRRINEHLARAEALGDDLQKVEGTSLDKGVLQCTAGVAWLDCPACQPLKKSKSAYRLPTSSRKEKTPLPFK